MLEEIGDIRAELGMVHEPVVQPAVSTQKQSCRQQQQRSRRQHRQKRSQYAQTERNKP